LLGLQVAVVIPYTVLVTNVMDFECIYCLVAHGKAEEEEVRCGSTIKRPDLAFPDPGIWGFGASPNVFIWFLGFIRILKP